MNSNINQSSNSCILELKKTNENEIEQLLQKKDLTTHHVKEYVKNLLKNNEIEKILQFFIRIYESIEKSYSDNSFKKSSQYHNINIAMLSTCDFDNEFFYNVANILSAEFQNIETTIKKLKGSLKNMTEGQEDSINNALHNANTEMSIFKEQSRQQELVKVFAIFSACIPINLEYQVFFKESFSTNLLMKVHELAPYWTILFKTKSPDQVNLTFSNIFNQDYSLQNTSSIKNALIALSSKKRNFHDSWTIANKESFFKDYIKESLMVLTPQDIHNFISLLRQLTQEGMIETAQNFVEIKVYASSVDKVMNEIFQKIQTINNIQGIDLMLSIANSYQYHIKKTDLKKTIISAFHCFQKNKMILSENELFLVNKITTNVLEQLNKHMNPFPVDLISELFYLTVASQDPKKVLNLLELIDIYNNDQEQEENAQGDLFPIERDFFQMENVTLSRAFLMTLKFIIFSKKLSPVFELLTTKAVLPDAEPTPLYPISLSTIYSNRMVTEVFKHLPIIDLEKNNPVFSDFLIKNIYESQFNTLRKMLHGPNIFNKKLVSYLFGENPYMNTELKKVLKKVLAQESKINHFNPRNPLHESEKKLYQVSIFDINCAFIIEHLFDDNEINSMQSWTELDNKYLIQSYQNGLAEIINERINAGLFKALEIATTYWFSNKNLILEDNLLYAATVPQDFLSESAQRKIQGLVHQNDFVALNTLDNEKNERDSAVRKEYCTLHVMKKYNIHKPRITKPHIFTTPLILSSCPKQESAVTPDIQLNDTSTQKAGLK